MEEFRGDPEQIERLRDAVRALHKNETVKSVQLERLAKKEAQLLGTPCMTRTDIDKFRKGKITRPNDFKNLSRCGMWYF